MARFTLFFIELFTSLFAINQIQISKEVINEGINILIIILIRVVFYYFEKKFKKVPLRGFKFSNKHTYPKK